MTTYVLTKEKKLKCQIIENENFIKYADFENFKVFLLNKTKNIFNYPPSLIINEVSESFEPDCVKFPKMLSYCIENGTVDYQVITDKMDNYSTRVFVCDTEKIKVVEK
jgi:hypothetical protein